MTGIYDHIGQHYQHHRHPDPRIATHLHAALQACQSVLNVGAGTGAYEPLDRDVIAVEPSATMLAQRQAPGGAVRARAEALPFADNSFDAVLAVLTAHHWQDVATGLRECRRVARHRVVLLTWDPASSGFWLLNEYFPELLALDRRLFPSLDAIAAQLGALTVTPLPLPADCSDGFLGAYWQRPHAYLQTEVRAAISSFSRLPAMNERLQQLRGDLQSGRWQQRNLQLQGLTELDCGYRIVSAQLGLT